MSASEANVAIDFLSNPDDTLDALAKIEQGLLKVQQRMGMMNSQFQRLAKNLPSAEISKRFDAMAAASSRFTAKMTASATAANQLTAAAGKTAALEQALTTVAQTLQSVTANANRAGRTLEWMARQAKQSTQSGNRATRRANASGGGSSAGGGGGGSDSGGASALSMLGRYAAPAAAVAAVGAAMKDTIKDAMNFEQAMAGVAAVGEIDKTSTAFNTLREAALSGSNAFNSIQKAEGLRELVAAGMSAEQAAGSLSSTLRLAAAGEIEMGRASEIMVASMSAFQLKASDSARIIDTLTAAANASPASIDDMGESMKFIAPVASAMKIPIETVSAALAVLANNGVRGGMAGRGLGAVFARLVAPTKDAEEAMANAGIAAYELSPSLNSVESVMQKLARLDQATLVKLFGAENLDISSILAANASGFGAMEKRMESATGAGTRFEQAIGDTAAGSAKKLGNAVDDLQVRIGSMAGGPIKSAVDGLTQMVGLMSSAMSDMSNNSDGGAVVNLKALREQFAAINKTILESKTEEEMQKSTDALDQFQKTLGRTQSEGISGASGKTKSYYAELAVDANLLKQALSGIFYENKRNAEAAMWAKNVRQDIKPGAGLSSFFKFDPGKWNPSEALKSSEQMQKEKTQAEAKMDLARQVALAEAEAAGDTTGVQKLEREIAFLREKKAIIEATGMSDTEAASAANRLLDARGSKQGPRFEGVADSMQAIGGGGGFFAGRQDTAELQRMQLTSLQSIAENTAKTAAVLGTSSSPGAVGGSLDKAILDVLKTIADHTGKSSVLRVTTT
ncbi:Phage tail tape measure protein [uncultured Caudovirales phage]|uniref:Phage tail tape measure protein n=1 Tax=uncultured Caudovirales phage TaxID=2100421 RepID=A0A6J5NUD3_9CAUD|nr:Phage tail tape measure protein [uncultured Caudovirales phage]